MKTQKFIGSWKLLEWSITGTDGTVSKPFGDHPIGRISYEANGQMAVQIMKENRTSFASEDFLKARTDEILPAFQSFIAYCGTFDVDLNSKTVVHHISISSFPNWIGQDQVRKFEFKEGQLILSTDFIGSNKHKLVWEKTEV
ncbi:lipocalin-like domain-containing protein [Gaetbulibacter aestuarii]|uniref:Lipocalin-like domain-containing protein n=1 Tax=Gaetbulibacter aestuarii TaxID=1502358 RepID=A0ABW7N0X1_9FLAO